MKTKLFFKLAVLHLSLVAYLSLTGCAEKSKVNGSVLRSDTRPNFLRAKVAASNHYKPSGLITDTTPTFNWPKTIGATKYLLGHEDAETSTRWYEYTLTAEEANCNQTNDTNCSYTPDDLIFEQYDEKAWWVKPHIPEGITQWSNTHVFKYAEVISPPQTIAIPISPSSKTATTRLNPTFVWSLGDDANTQFQIGYEDAAGIEWSSHSFSKNQTQCNAQQCSYTPAPSQTQFNHGDIKTWWIRGLTNNTWSDWSEGSTFNIDTSKNPQDLLILTHDESNEIRLLNSKNNTEFLPKNTLNSNYKMWAQAITILDNGFYLMSHNIKVKNPATGKREDTYILFNLLAPNGTSIANKRLDYASHGQDLSVEKISDNQYSVYTQRDNGKGIARFILDTTNIDFNQLNNNNSTELNIAHNRDIVVDNKGASTPTLNFEQDKFAIVSYISRKVLDIQLIDKETLLMGRRFKLDLSNGQPNGNYNQGIAMKNNIIYIARGDWKSQTPDNIKKLYLLDATTGELITSFSFTLQNASSYQNIEPEGLVIVDNALYIMLPTRKNSKVAMKLYKLLDI